ncbi:MAG TPA: hypothetical protein H9867_05430 [Candidatus Corynebacterium gallistercoris]|uniref:Uncharacterized protein n=1 Tax=Candidatus Corynebacterium gallistercoris TaxID=2838530 RepID=A0A9D1UR44_9CORY|nr:hypothetical protein [Candidatus Corynebacterium gallistercoris]
MPNKTIYISDSDLPIAERAAELAGGLSPAAVEGMKLLVNRAETQEKGFHEVQVTDASGTTAGRRAFYGRSLATMEQSLPGRRITWTAYVTPKENLAVVRTSRPDFVGVIGGDATSASPSSPRTQAKPRGVAAAEEALKQVQNTFRRSPDLEHGQRIQRMAWEFLTGSLENLGLENLGFANDTAGQSRGFSNAVPVRQDTEEGALAAGASRASEPQDAEASSLEVFSSTEELRQAAFRPAGSTEGLGPIPAEFITATERGLGGDEVEYLDI